MSDPLSMSALTTLLASINATFSQALADGHTLSGSQDGTTTEKCGRGPLLAKVSASPEKVRCTPTIGGSSERAPRTRLSIPATSGPRSTSSLPPGSLQRFLGNRLESALASTGSPLYALTWKTLAMQSGEPIYRLAASGRRTFDSGSFGSALPAGWATPRAGETSDNAPTGHFQSTSTPAKLSGWPTPIAQTFECRDVDRMMERRRASKARNGNGNGFGMTLEQVVVVLSGWPTPNVNDAKGSGYCYGPNGERYLKLPGAAVSGRPSPRATDAREALTGWATPATRDYRHANAQPLSERGGGSKGEQLPNQVKHLIVFNEAQHQDGPARITADGRLLTGSAAEMPSGGQLNPDFCRWLIGYPSEWGECAQEAFAAMGTR